jgi:glycosyltransferase involved in cell wall biosynthesis
LPKKLSILIPAYNEKNTAAQILDRVLAIPLDGIEKEVIVVESNSTDGTRELVKDFEKRRQIRAIYEERPMGKGHAVKTALAKATGDWVLIQDADLEYDVADYPRLLEPLRRGETAFVLGSRHLGHRDWRYRRTGVGKWLGCVMDFGVWAYTQFFNLLYGTRLTDPCTMYKLFRRDCLKNISLHSDGFELDWEIVAKLIRKGFPPIELAVSYNSRSFKEGKKIKLWRDGWRSLKAIVRYRFEAL